MASHNDTADEAGQSAGLKARASMDAIELLKGEHREIEALFQSYDRLVAQDASSHDRQILAEQICTLLTVHTLIEEELLYPAARAALKELPWLEQARLEHARSSSLVAQLQGMQPGDELFYAKLHLLGEYVAQHAAEEEQLLFPLLARQGLDLRQLGERMNLRREALLEA